MVQNTNRNVNRMLANLADEGGADDSRSRVNSQTRVEESMSYFPLRIVYLDKNEEVTVKTSDDIERGRPFKVLEIKTKKS